MPSMWHRNFRQGTDLLPLRDRSHRSRAQAGGLEEDQTAGHRLRRLRGSGHHRCHHHVPAELSMMRAIGAVILFGFLAAPASAQSPSVDFRSLGRAAIEELAAQSFDTFIGRLDPKVGAALTRDKLAALWSNIISQAGAYKSIMSAEARDAQG